MSSDVSSSHDRALHRLCVVRGWRAQRLGSDLYVFDDRTDALLRVDEQVVGALLATAPGTPLREALREAAAAAATAMPVRPDGDCAVVPLDLLGVRVDVECVHQACADGVREYYSALYRPEAAASAEVVVRCDLPDAGRHLFRARDDGAEGTPLEGVTVRTLGGTAEPWRSIHQPLPPLTAPPFRDRFVALHAATVRTAAGHGVVIAGERHAGKTLAALTLANQYGGELLADETTFVHCRTTVVEPFPHAVGVWREGRKVRVPVDSICHSIAAAATPVSQVVFLSPRPGPKEVRRVAPGEALRLLLPHHRHGGASAGDAIATVFRLAERLDAWSISYDDHTALGALVAEVCAAP